MNNLDFIVLHYEVILVTGGHGRHHLDSTELMEERVDSSDFKPWRPAADLPSPRYHLQAASLDNKVFLFGQ